MIVCMYAHNDNNKWWANLMLDIFWKLLSGYGRLGQWFENETVNYYEQSSHAFLSSLTGTGVHVIQGMREDEISMLFCVWGKKLKSFGNFFSGDCSLDRLQLACKPNLFHKLSLVFCSSSFKIMQRSCHHVFSCVKPLSYSSFSHGMGFPVLFANEVWRYGNEVVSTVGRTGINEAHIEDDV